MRKIKDIDSLQKAKNYAFLLLKFRLRSEKEIYERLKKKKFSQGTIQKTLSYLKNNNLINDNYFAGVWIESRLKKPLGLRRLRQELNIKGIDRQIINSQIEKIKKNYSEADIVSKLAKERIDKLKGIAPQKIKRRVYQYLLRRGFSPGVVIDAIERL